MSSNGSGGPGPASLPGFRGHQVHYRAQGFLLRISFEPAQAKMIDLAVSPGAVADDFQSVPQFGLATQGPRIFLQVFHQGAGEARGFSRNTRRCCGRDPPGDRGYRGRSERTPPLPQGLWRGRLRCCLLSYYLLVSGKGERALRSPGALRFNQLRRSSGSGAKLGSCSENLSRRREFLQPAAPGAGFPFLPPSGTFRCPIFRGRAGRPGKSSAGPR